MARSLRIGFLAGTLAWVSACAGNDAAPQDVPLTDPGPMFDVADVLADNPDVVDADRNDAGVPDEAAPADLAPPDPAATELSPADLTEAAPEAVAPSTCIDHCVYFCPVAAPDPAFVPKPGVKSATVFDPAVIGAFRLDFPTGEWEHFLALWRVSVAPNEDDPEYARCAFTFDGETFADAACRPRGSWEDWMDEIKPQFKIRFNHWDKSGRFRGLRSINLEYFRWLAAPVRDRLAMWMMDQAGLQAARVNHVRLNIDGADYGLYQNIEAVDKEFLENRFANPDGNLYEKGWQKKTHDDNADSCDIWTLGDLVDDEPLEGDHAAFFAALPKIVDLHELLQELAAEVVFPTPDNLSNGSTNFYYYDEPGRGFVALPWDLDTVMEPGAPPDSDVWEFWGDSDAPCRLRQLMNQNPVWKQEFIDRLVAIRDGAFADVATQAATVCSQVRPEILTDLTWLKEHGDVAAFDDDCAVIATHVAARIAYLKTALGK